MKVQKFDTKIFMAILHLLFSQLTFLNSPHNLMNLSVPSIRFVTLSGAENFAIIMFIMHAIWSISGDFPQTFVMKEFGLWWDKVKN